MAFGFGFNKQKALRAAEKFVQQAKLQNAIAEYEKVLKADPKDLTVANTVGDLYARLGDKEKALECFKSVGDAYASQGFTVKAIAMYKKLSKIKPSLESALRLAELYTLQGLFNDARAQYLQVAEEFLRAGELEQAVRIFQKTLEMDPENIPMRTRLAEVYVRLSRKPEAWQIFLAAAESLRAKGQLAAAEQILQRMLTLDPGNSQALRLRGENALDAGDITGAIEFLEKIPDLDSHSDGLRALFQAYLQSGRLPEAEVLAGKLFTVHSDESAIKGYAAALVASGNFEHALDIYRQYSDALLASDSAGVLENLHLIIGHVRENLPALETLLAIFTKAGESTHVTEVYELLAHAYVQSGDLDRAREYYLKLTQLEPQNQLHARNYQQVADKLAGNSSKPLITPEEGAVLVDELEATAPFIDQRYPDDVALAVRAALTDAELFISYNMPAKALAPLLAALPQAPRDLRLNQRLAALYTRAGNLPEAAVCCFTLESLYHDAGHPEDATRYGELARRCEQRASGTASESTARTHAATDPSGLPAVSSPAAHGGNVSRSGEQTAAASGNSGLFFHSAIEGEPEVAQTVSQFEAEFEVQASPTSVEAEIDISDEWEGSASLTSSADAAGSKQDSGAAAEKFHSDSPEISSLVEEVRFYLKHFMIDQAEGAIHKLEALKPETSLLLSLREEMATAKAQAPAAEYTLTEDDAAETNAAPLHQAEIDSSLHAPAWSSHGGSLDDFVGGLEASLGPEFLPEASAPSHAETPQHASELMHKETNVPKHAANPAAAPALQEFVSDLEASLGNGFLAQADEPDGIDPYSELRSAAVSHIHASEISPASTPQPMASAAAAGMSVSGVESEITSPMFSYHPRPRGPSENTSPAELSAGVDLADMFGELKHELEEDAASTDEDPETHYNLGVAFREMGLLDEAIGELQKVCQAVEQGHSFPNVMQTYTWLALCFLDKGVPEAAIRWYESALKLPSLDQDTRTALHYELGGSYETAGNKAAALNNFMEVYGSNIDYRDVAERIKALKS